MSYPQSRRIIASDRKRVNYPSGLLSSYGPRIRIRRDGHDRRVTGRVRVIAPERSVVNNSRDEQEGGAHGKRRRLAVTDNHLTSDEGRDGLAEVEGDTSRARQLRRVAPRHEPETERVVERPAHRNE